MPGILFEALADHLMHTWPDNWTPADMDIFAWRSVSWPFYCLPFWWFISLGLDATLKRRRLRWPTLTFGILLCALTIVVSIAMIATSYGDPNHPESFPIWGLGLWSILFAVFPVHWVLQRRALPAFS